MEEMCANMHIRRANWWYRAGEYRKCYQLGQVLFRAELMSAVELSLESALASAVSVGCREVHLVLCVSSVWGFFGVAIVARKASGRVVLTKHSRVSFYHSLLLLMPRKLNTQLLLFLDLGARFLEQILRFLSCGAHKPLFSHFGYVPGQVLVELYQVYTISLPCHRSRHDDNLQEISCCFKQWDAAITLTIYASVASSRAIIACFIHSRGCFSTNSSVKFPELPPSWGSISWTVRTNALVDHGGFPLRAAMNWSRSSRRTPTVQYTVSWRPFTMVWIYSHPKACCFWFVLLPVVRTIFQCAYWVICLVASLAV